MGSTAKASINTVAIVGIVAVVVIAAVLAIVLTRGSTSGPTYGSSTAATTVQQTTAATTASSTAASSSASTTAPAAGTVLINVELSNPQGQFVITPNVITVQSGENVVLNVTNEGTMQHALDVQLVGSASVTPYLNPGQNFTLKFTAPSAGNYTYYCPVDSHRELGMIGTLVVTSG